MSFFFATKFLPVYISIYIQKNRFAIFYNQKEFDRSDSFLFDYEPFNLKGIMNLYLRVYFLITQLINQLIEYQLIAYLIALNYFTKLRCNNYGLDALV